ncbi:MAG TPA: helix-hairpin-helix domain-containing protein [Solirubrobacterales bacterium]
MQPPQAQPQPPQGTVRQPAGAQAGLPIPLNTVSFEELRAHGLSVTQATRLLAHRERVERFQSIDELDQIPGIPEEQLEDLKRRATL